MIIPKSNTARKRQKMFQAPSKNTVQKCRIIQLKTLQNFYKTCTAWNSVQYGVISGPYFPVFGLNTGKYGPEITPYLDTFHAVLCFLFRIEKTICAVSFSCKFSDVFRSSFFSLLRNCFWAINQCPEAYSEPCLTSKMELFAK